MNQPCYGYWLNYPNRGGFIESMDALFPRYDPEAEFIVYLDRKERDQMMMDLIRRGLVESED